MVIEAGLLVSDELAGFVFRNLAGCVASEGGSQQHREGFADLGSRDGRSCFFPPEVFRAPKTNKRLATEFDGDASPSIDELRSQLTRLRSWRV